jgi:cardiolipin synthase
LYIQSFINFNYRSLLSDDEVNAVILNREFAVEMERIFAGDLKQSDQIQCDKWEKRPLWQKVNESLATYFPVGCKIIRS